MFLITGYSEDYLGDYDKLLKINNLQYSYGRRKILPGLTFSLSASELIHIRGSNGTGKTTLLELLAGLKSMQSGTLEWSKKLARVVPHSAFLSAENNGHFLDLNGLDNSYSSEVKNPFYKSCLEKAVKEKAEIPQEREPNLDEIKDIEKMEDDYFHRDDV